MKRLLSNTLIGIIGIAAFVQQVSAQAITGDALYAPVSGGARILAAQGTAASPAIGFTGAGVVPPPTGGSWDDGGGGNGIFRPLANTMAFSTSSTERMRITPGGAIGIGTTAPSQRLQVSGGNVLLDYWGTSTGNLYFGGVTSSSQNGMRMFFVNNPGGGVKNGYIDLRTTGGSASDGLVFRLDGTTGTLEKMRICANGNVGIGIAAPTSKLHISTSASNDGIRVAQTGATAATLSLLATGVGAKNWSFHSTGSGNTQGAGHLLFWDWTANLERMRINSAGDVGIGLTANPGTYRLFVGGSGYYSGGLFVGSDRRFKKDVRTLDGALATVTRLRGVQYEYRQGEFADRNFPAGKTDGFVAQELREVLPELVQEGSDGYLAVNYQGVIPVLTEAVKELKAEKDAEVIALEARLAEKDRQVSELEARLARLEAVLDRAATPAAEVPNFLIGNQPNPFSGTTTVNCAIPETVQTAVLVVTDLSGREISRQTLPGRGQTSVEINLHNAPAGTYLCTILADGKNAGTLKLAVNGR